MNNIECIEADIHGWKPGRRFDGVVGRHILIHSKDPLAVLRDCAALLHARGLPVFHEYDFLSSIAAGLQRPLPLCRCYPNLELEVRAAETFIHGMLDTAESPGVSHLIFTSSKNALKGVLKHRKVIGVLHRASSIPGGCTDETQEDRGGRDCGAADDDRNQDDRVQHVLLLSIDGMHAVDFENCAAAGEEAESPPAET